MSVDPESLSKEKLKAELRKSGVAFNRNENKPYYIRLYRDKLREKELSRAEFSDDEDTRRTPRGPRRSKTDSPSGLVNEVKMMSDSTLRSVLIGHGENPGPITATTRNLYERKLLGFLEKASTPKRSPRVVHKYVQYQRETEGEKESFMAQAEEELSDEEVPVKKPMRQVHEARIYKEVVSNYNLRNRQGEDRRPADAQSPRREQTGTPRRDESSAWKQAALDHSESSISMCEIMWKLSVLIAVVVVSFLVYDHMTTPEGMKSVAVQGYEYLHPSSIMKVIKPKVCASKVKPDASKSPPSNDGGADQSENQDASKSPPVHKPSLILKEEEDPDPPRAEESPAKEEPKVPAKEKPKAPAKEEPKAPAKEEPKAPAKEEPKVPAKEEPKAPAKEEPKVPAKEEPKVPAKEEPKAPAKEEPKVPAKEEPKAPAKEEPKVPAKEEPKVPAKEEPKAPAKEEPKAPAKEEPKAPAEEDSTAPTEAPKKDPPKSDNSNKK